MSPLRHAVRRHHLGAQAAAALLASAVFVAIGVGMLRYPRVNRQSDLVWGWIDIAFFGVGLIVFLFQLLQTHPTLDDPLVRDL